MDIEPVVKVAERIMQSGQRDLWDLADAVLRVVPALPEGRNSSGGPGVSEQLMHMASALADVGITRPDGSAYSALYFRDLRDTAVAWPVGTRQPEGAFGTHRACAGELRPTFLALCAVARGENADRPENVDSRAWRDALDKMATVRHGFKVSEQAVRIAAKRPAKNVPTKPGATFGELITHLFAAAEGLASFRSRVTSIDFSDEDRQAMSNVLRRLHAEVSDLLCALDIDLSDEALAAVMDSEQ